MTKRSNGSPADGLPTLSDCNQSRSLPVNPQLTLGETRIDPNQQRTVRNYLEPAESAFHTTGKGE